MEVNSPEANKKQDKSSGKSGFIDEKLFKSRAITIFGEINDKLAKSVTERLLALGIASGGVLAAGLLLLGEPVLWPLLASGGGGGVGGGGGGGNDGSGDGARVVAAVAALAPLAMGVLPLNAAVYVLDGVLLGAGDFAFLAAAMAGAAGVSVFVLSAVGGSGSGGEDAAVSSPSPLSSFLFPHSSYLNAFSLSPLVPLASQSFPSPSQSPSSPFPFPLFSLSPVSL